MVDSGRFLPGRPFWELVEDHLRPGDMATHCFECAGALDGTQRLAAVPTLKGGEVVWDWNSLTGTDYRNLPQGHGVGDRDVLLVPPR